MKMGYSTFDLSLILLFSLWLTLISPSHSFDCSSLKHFVSTKKYTNCIQLPTLNSTLHFRYNATNSSLSIAFSAPLSNPEGWIAWAINPRSTGMMGSQALVALKNKGSLVVKTYNISSYSSIVEGKLSFDVWDLKAETNDDGKMVLYGSLKVPSNVKKVNHVWQVGLGVTNGHLMKHEFGKDNLGSFGELKLVKKIFPNRTALPPSLAPQVDNHDLGDGFRVGEINAGFSILAMISMLVFM